jgi:hypothetical protein
VLHTPADRIATKSPRALNDRIADDTEASIAHYASHPESIERRIAELDREWDVDRFIQLGGGSWVLVGLGLGLFVRKRFFLISAFAASSLIAHAIFGVAPPTLLLRALEVRTKAEIEEERRALELLL